MPCCNCAFVAGTKGHHRKVLVIGGQFSGLFSASDLKKHFHVTIVDAKEFFEYTPGVLRCFVKPAHFDSLSFTLQPVIERSMGVKFIWGEVKELDGANKTATIKTMFSDNKDTISWDYCMICAGCNFGPFKPMGESLWFPTVHEEGRKVSDWAHIDERFHEGRRRHILEEYHKLHDYNSKSATVLIVGAGFIGVEWATELEHFFPNLKITIIDFLPNCLGPLPERAATYCSDYMHASGIKEFYGKKFAPDDQKFWDEIELPNKPDVQYVCIGVKASNYFMPKETLSEKGPGGGGWIHMNEFLQVTYKPTETRKCTVWKAGAVKCGKKTMDAKIGDVWLTDVSLQLAIATTDALRAPESQQSGRSRPSRRSRIQVRSRPCMRARTLTAWMPRSTARTCLSGAVAT
jgi:hypothetical protein